MRYIVKEGDNLYKISKKMYGVGFLWRLIYLFNKDKISNPNVIDPQQAIIIPFKI